MGGERKRRSPAPAFRQASPFNPIFGRSAKISGAHEILSRVAMMQIIEEDTHPDYLVCRGFDPESFVFLDSVTVAKSYPERGTCLRYIGDVFAAIKSHTPFGTNTGISVDSVAQPRDLAEQLEIITDDDGNPIWWVSLQDMPLVPFKLSEALASNAQADAKIFYSPDDDPGDTDLIEIIVRDVTGSSLESGEIGWAQQTSEEQDGKRIYDMVSGSADSRLVPFYNNSGVTLLANAVVQITGTHASEDSLSEVLSVEKTSTTFAGDSATQIYAVNSSSEVASGEWGACYVSGDCVALVKTGTPAVGEMWGPKPSDQSISKYFPGFVIVGYLDSANELAVVRFDPIVSLIGKTTGSITAASSSDDYTINVGGTFGSESDSGWTTVPTARNRGAAISSGKWIALTFVAGRWEMTPLECS